MSSACEAVNADGFISERNTKQGRTELTKKTVRNLSVGDFVMDINEERIGRIHRHVIAGGIEQADVRYWRDGTSPLRKVTKMVPLDFLERCDDPRKKEEAV